MVLIHAWRIIGQPRTHPEEAIEAPSPKKKLRPLPRPDRFDLKRQLTTVIRWSSVCISVPLWEIRILSYFSRQIRISGFYPDFYVQRINVLKIKMQ